MREHEHNLKLLSALLGLCGCLITLCEQLHAKQATTHFATHFDSIVVNF